MMDEPRLIVPALDDEPWPTLGPEVCDFIEDNLCHGPGDVIGESIALTPEERLYLYRVYEVHPRGSEFEGRRRFKRCTYSRRKGARKTELAAWVAIGELDPTAPVRCDGWRVLRGEWVPVGRAVRDPFIPMVAFTEEQTEDLAYAAVKEILQRCAIANDYDVGEERVRHRRAPGQIAPYASAPSSREGARTTHNHFDETHLFVTEKLRKAHRVMLRNIPKRPLADAWSHETTTMYGPGEGSVAEGTHLYAEAIHAGRARERGILFDHRQASEAHDITAAKGLRDAIVEASGDALAWLDIEAVISLFEDPAGDEAENRRYWLNQRRKASSRWLSPMVWRDRVGRKRAPAAGTPVVLAFDGSYSRDSTVIIGATIEARPHVFVVGIWERPVDLPVWRVPRSTVEASLRKAMERYDVVEVAPDPPGWHKEIEDWEDEWGEVVVRFETKQPHRMGPACDDFEQAFKDSEFTHDGDDRLARHIGNCTPVDRAGYTVVVKPEHDSPDKIDAAVGAIIAHHRARWHYAHRSDAEPMVAWR